MSLDSKTRFDAGISRVKKSSTIGVLQSSQIKNKVFLLPVTIITRLLNDYPCTKTNISDALLKFVSVFGQKPRSVSLPRLEQL